MVGQCFLEGFLAVNANGQSDRVVVLWNEMVFTKVNSRMGQFSVAVKLMRYSYELEVVVVLVYGLENVTKRAERWGELEEMAATFQGSLMVMGGDFNVTLKAEDRRNNTIGQDPDSEGF